MDVFVVGSLLATALVMIGALLDEFASRAHTQPDPLSAGVADYAPAYSPDRQEALPCDEAA